MEDFSDIQVKGKETEVFVIGSSSPPAMTDLPSHGGQPLCSVMCGDCQFGMLQVPESESSGKKKSKKGSGGKNLVDLLKKVGGGGKTWLKTREVREPDDQARGSIEKGAHGVM